MGVEWRGHDSRMGWRRDLNGPAALIQFVILGLAVMLVGLAGVSGSWGDAPGTLPFSALLSVVGLLMSLLGLRRLRR
ncbi:hypothetical protein GCM10023349_05660 [Nocardioides conyzicola]|uniref:Uncharacterized protein n=1 Tax=Nocardioides conyzicola TaxID=1651781 RepID=A0ABP8WPI7_9ACTN